MKRLFVLLIILCQIAAAAPPAPDRTAASASARRLAVLDLEAVGTVDQHLARPLTDSIRREIVRSGSFDVIDRGHMEKILKEQAFQMTGVVAQDRAVAAGQVLGVGTIVVGSLSMVGKTYYLSLSLINVETAKTAAVEEESCKCEADELIEAAKRVAGKLMAACTAPSWPSGDRSADKQAPPVSGSSYRDPATGMEFVLVKGGCFNMGDAFGDGDTDENPLHEVCVDDFHIGTFEVTQGQWKNIMGENPSVFKGGDQYPVDHVSWDEAQAFIAKLKQRSGANYRLPTEAEWEYAARSRGKMNKWSGTSDDSGLSAFAWHFTNANGQTHPVGQKAPNSLGIHDMTGNVWEWTSDLYQERYYAESPKQTPRGPDSGRNRVMRGGSWTDDARVARTTCRVQVPPSARNRQSGLRVVLPAR